MKKILIGGPMYGEKNIGDESILESIIEDVRRILKDVKIRVITNDLARTKHKLGVETIPLSGPIKKIKSLFWCDLLICGGGTILSDCPRFALPLVKYARLLRKPVYIYGVGMNRVEDINTRKYVVKYVDKANVVTVRDGDVRQRLLYYGARGDNIFATADPAFLKKPQEELSWIVPMGKGLIVGMNIAVEEDVRENINIIEYIKLCDWLIGEMDALVVFIPTNFREGMDRDIAKTIIKNLDSKSAHLLCEEEISSSALMAMLKAFDLVVTSRLHLGIFAALANVPVVGIRRGEKWDGFLKSFGDSPVSDVKDMTADKCIAKIGDILRNKSKYKKKITTSVERLKAKARRNGELLERFLKS